MSLPTALSLAHSVRSGERTARSIVGDHLAGIDESGLNAFVVVHKDRALGDADRIDAAVAAGHDPGPLAGVPVALKDLMDHAGETTTCGSSFYREVPTVSATVVRRLEDAGAIVIGRTGLHEFAYGFSSENHWFGPVHNPWDLDTSPGGSSGGSAAAVAAGHGAVGVGTDTGGSIRVPAGLTGLFGLKPTHGSVPLTGVFPLAASVDTVGPFARSTSDLEASFRVMAGHDPDDAWSTLDQPDPAIRWPLRIGVPVEWLASAPLDSAIRSAFERALDGVADLGADVTEISAPMLEPWGELNALMGAQAARVHREWMADPAKRYGPEVAERLALALEVTSDQLADALAWQASLKTTTANVFRSVDVLATPAVGANRKVIGDPVIKVDGENHPYRVALAYFASLVNHMHTPALVAPLAGGEGLPHSIQFIGPWGHEAGLLDLAGRAEQAGILGFRPPPHR